jgi:chemotaxis protein methyltransferase CheR
MIWDPPAFDDVMRLLSARTGLAVTPSRRAGLEAGVRRAMRRLGADDLRQYRDQITSDERALHDLIAELTVGETYFFREPAHFQLIRRRMLPEIEARWGRGHVLRAWSAGCSSGEEAYSLAITLVEEGFAGRAYLLATDISEPASARARRGVYSEWSLRGAGAAAALPYLRKHDDHWIINDEIRQLVTFKYHNLAQDDYPALVMGIWGMDLILCRNVLIYFDPELVRVVAQRLFAALADGGWLITASTDPPLAGAVPFEKVVTGEGVFYRRGSAQPLSPWERVPEGRVRAAAPPVAAASSSGVTAAAPQPLSPWERVPEGRVRAAAPPDPVASEGPSDGRVRAAAPPSAVTSSADAAAGHVRELANRDVAEAERVCAAATARHPLSAELHYLRSVLLLNLGRERESAREARRALFLDRSLAIVQFTLALTLRRLGDRVGARRGYRNARDLCARRPGDEVVPLSDGITADRLAQAAEIEIGLLDAMPGGAR